ncbi:MAG: prolyl oligopeptidase family serine peptidase [Gemmataceae bacterium]
METAEFAVEKLHFQSRPGLYVTADFYRPLKVTQPLPTILYLCGHGPVKVDGVSFGNKVSYQHHAAWFARHGYCCLIIDTLQLGEIEGIHHGTYRLGQWWWISRGYTPAGVEAWNCIRALDYLASRREVNMSKIGVTGRSGGGAYTWWVAALDDRPACLVPVAGITDLTNHVVDGCVEGHCDCMYHVNTYGWDFATVAALAAPRPMLISNSDKDTIFPLDGVYRLHVKVREIYRLHKANDKLGLLITEGPHKDTQDLQVPAFRWMNRWLKGIDEPISRVADKPFEPKQLKVFDKLPTDEVNTTIQESFVPVATVDRPTDVPAWDRQRESLMANLKNRTFRNWPPLGQPLNVTTLASKESSGLRLDIVEFATEDNLRLPLYVVRGAKHAKPSLVVLTAVDTEGWNKWLAEMSEAFGDTLPAPKGIATDKKALESTAKTLERFDWAFATLPPRGEGPHAWNLDAKKESQLRRRFILLGRTTDDAQVWDVRRALATIGSTPDCSGARLWLQGHGRMAGVALYAGLFEPRVERFDLYNLPPSHRDGPQFLGVQRVLDMPQAVALAYPRKVMLYGADTKAWSFAEDVAKLYDAAKPPLQMRAPVK